MAKVDATRTEYDELLPIWELIGDCIEGSTAVKAAGDKYLPRPNPTDVSSENKKRYEQYTDRAVFYNVTARTVAGLNGQVFKKDPKIKLPGSIEGMQEDVDGAGTSLNQQSKKVLSQVLSFSRAGLFVDYPETNGTGATMKEINDGLIRPSIVQYGPKAIINWRTRKIGGVHRLSLIVLSEETVQDDDGFEETMENQWRVLRLDEGNLYRVELYVKGEGDKEFVLTQEYEPTDANGNRLDHIPFVFIGASDNNPEPDTPLMHDMAVLNIGHYRNSADYEEAVFITGQPTVYFSGLTEDWVKNVLKGKVQMGSRAAIALPEGGAGGLLQVEANSMPSEAMKHKEQQMVALGAKLIETATVERTATEVVIRDFGEHANLSTVSQNVSEAYQKALGYAQAYASRSEEEIIFELNKDFEVTKLDANEQAMVISLWQGAAITKSEMRDILRRGGIAKLPDEEYDEAIEAEGPPDWIAPSGADFNLQGKTE